MTGYIFSVHTTITTNQPDGLQLSLPTLLHSHSRRNFIQVNKNQISTRAFWKVKLGSNMSVGVVKL